MTATHAELATARSVLRSALLTAAEMLHTAGSALHDAMQDAPKAATQEDWLIIGTADDLLFRLGDLSELILGRSDPDQPQLVLVKG